MEYKQTYIIQLIKYDIIIKKEKNYKTDKTIYNPGYKSIQAKLLFCLFIKFNNFIRQSLIILKRLNLIFALSNIYFDFNRFYYFFIVYRM